MAVGFTEPAQGWYKSKTIWAALVATIIAIVSAMYGETSPLVVALIAVASAFGVYGRIVATSRIGWTSSKKK